MTENIKVESKEEHKLGIKRDIKASSKEFWVLAFKTLGVVYGDIGTSPLYTVNTIFSNIPASSENIIGAISLIVYTITLLVTIKYVIFILRARNEGEGGIFALGSLVSHNDRFGPKAKIAVTVVSIFGASFIIADGVFTPAVSVLSAIEGLALGVPSLSSWAQWITVVILVVLFLVQRFGTGKVGAVFAPIMLVWFLVLFALGMYRIVLSPSALRALNPIEAFKFFGNGASGYLALGSVFLAVTGLEALYADVGHFGAGAIRISWLSLVYPALIINYLGQGGLLLSDNSLITNPFFLSMPKGMFWPVLILSTFATIIASQALITGCFSLVSHAISLGIFPSLKIYHKSKSVFGQVYIPEVNYLLMVLTIAVVIGFRTTARLTQAYGFTVCTVMTTTTVLYLILMITKWRTPWWKVLPFGLFLLVDLAFLGANAAKVPNGGWVALVFGGVFSTIMLIWFFGEKMFWKAYSNAWKETDLLDIPVQHRDYAGTEMKEVKTEQSTDIKDLISDSVHRVPDTMGIFLNPQHEEIPAVFRLLALRLRAIPETAAFLTLDVVPVPKKRLVSVEKITEHVWKVRAEYGYSEGKVVVLDVVKSALEQGLPRKHFTIFYNMEQIKVVNKNIFLRIFLSAYAAMKRLWGGVLANFELPVSNVIAAGLQVAL